MAEENQMADIAAEAQAAAVAKPKRGAKVAAAAVKKAAATKKASSPAKAAALVKKAAKSASSAHPSYLEMVISAVQALKERSGSSRQAILKYILANYNVVADPKAVNLHLKLALKRGLTSGTIKNAKVLHIYLFVYLFTR